MIKVDDFKIENIDGCEFIKYKGLGSALISFERDEMGCPTGNVLYVFPDASHGTKTFEQAQVLLDTGLWTIYR